MKPQVIKSHYTFDRYLNKKRWISMWHQLDEVVALNPKSVLEVGPGPGAFKSIAQMFGCEVKTLDIAADLSPDYLGSASDMPLEDNQFDVVCAFQVLEHLPWENALKALREMSRVSSGHIVLSLPDANVIRQYSLYLPKIGNIYFELPRIRLRPKVHKFDGEHYWEIGKKGHRLASVIHQFTQVGNLTLIKTYRVRENPYHRFFIFRKGKAPEALERDS